LLGICDDFHKGKGARGKEVQGGKGRYREVQKVAFILAVVALAAIVPPSLGKGVEKINMA
jgi:hypothetical protein